MPIAGLMIAGGVIKGIGAILSYKEKKRQAKENRKAAIENLGLTINTLNARETQERAAASQAIQNIALESDILEGQTLTSAAAGNVAGASVDALLQDVAAQEGRATSTIGRNLDLSLGQLALRRTGAHMEARQRIAGVPNPSVGALALNLAGIGLDTYANLSIPR